MAVVILLTLCSVLVLLAVAILWLAVRLGFHQRLPLLLARNCSIDQVLDRAADRHGDDVLIELETPLGWEIPRIEDTRADPHLWSARRIKDTVAYLAGALQRMGVLRNDRVVIVKQNNFDVFLFSLATIRLGAIAAPVNAGLDAALFAGYAKNLDAKLIVTDAATYRKMSRHAGFPETGRILLVDGDPSEIAHAAAGERVIGLRAALRTATRVPNALPRGPQDPMLVVHTSGTTGIPKAVILVNRGLTQSMRATFAFNLVSRRDHVYLALPFNHQVTNLYLHSILLLGMKATCCADFDPGRVVNKLSAGDVTVFFGFPITYLRMADEHLAAARLKKIRIWGTTADASHEVHQRRFVQMGGFFRHLGIPVDGSVFVDGLGSSEVGIAALLRMVFPWTRRFGRRVGRPVPLGPRVKVVDHAGMAVKKGSVGRLMINGPCMFEGYWNAHDKYYAAMNDGWWFTGDLVYQAENGEYVHIDREVDAISHKRGVSYTLPMEETILKHQDVFDACVFAARAPGIGTVPAAAIALKPNRHGVSEERLKSELNALLPSSDQLHDVLTVPWERFPIGVTGKTLKRQFREEFNHKAAEAQGRSPALEPCEVHALPEDNG